MGMSALPPRADMLSVGIDVRLVPRADIRGQSEAICRGKTAKPTHVRLFRDATCCRTFRLIASRHLCLREEFDERGIGARVAAPTCSTTGWPESNRRSLAITRARVPRWAVSFRKRLCDHKHT